MKIVPILTHKKPLNGIKFKVKAEDCDIFFDKTFEKMNDVFIKKQKNATLILENPRYDEFEDSFEEIKFANWASQNLNRKGFQTSIPSALDPDGSFDLYILTSQKAQENLSKKFFGFRSIPALFIDSFKAISTSNKFSRMVGGAKYDIHYADAYNFLYEHEVNKHQNNRFQKFIKGLNIKEVEYKPPNNDRG